MATQNARKLDFDYYLTNLDWDDGSPIERDIKQFDRNDVFDHTYEKPGFYSVKGLAFKFERVMIEATPPMSPIMNVDYETIYDDIPLVKSKETITELSSSLSDFKIRDRFDNTPWVISRRPGAENQVRMVGSGYLAAVSYTHLTLPTNREV